jgi:uncharacterized protein
MSNYKQNVRAYDIDDFLIESKSIDQTFRIQVFQPSSCRPSKELLPVLYATDGDLFFHGLASMANMMQLLGEAPPFILVGIGYQDARASELLRWRDFPTHEIRWRFVSMLERLLRSEYVSGIDSLDQIVKTTDARQFLDFIQVELMPLIRNRYPVRPYDNSYCGYSAGGSFGLYTLFNQPECFGRYILGSPATSCDGQNFGIELANSFVRSGRTMSNRVYISVGELEEFKQGHEDLDLVVGYYRLVKFLRRAEIPGLDLITQVFPGETHATAWMWAFSHGVRQLFDPNLKMLKIS